RLQRTHLAALLGVVRAGRPARVALPDGWQGVLAGGLLDFVPAGGRAPAGGDARLRGSRGRASARGDAANRARRVRTGRPRATPLPRAARQERP
ncbi:MAG TPA: hypothetical protein VGU27_05265, partial [Candidatus Eisenbacteria bacterium]|nr:hypothetical protein [Candidatus Eisenbacteria bacterium]